MSEMIILSLSIYECDFSYKITTKITRDIYIFDINTKLRNSL